MKTGGSWFVLVCLCVASAGGPERPPDVVIFLLDDVGYVDLQLVPTPNIDRLAERGVSFERGYANPWCQPTRDAILRSVWTAKGHGKTCLPPVADTLDSGELTIAKVMDLAGYETALFGKWHLGTNRLNENSSDPGSTYDEWRLTPHLLGYESWLAGVPENIRQCIGGVSGGRYNRWTRVDNGDVTISTEYQTTAMLNTFGEWAMKTPPETPRFAMVAFQAPHSPYNIPPPSILPASYNPPQTPTDREKFEAMIRSVDVVIGRMLESVAEDAFVIVLGDNGTPGCSPAGCAFDVTVPSQDPEKVKHTAYEGGVHVPFLVSHPKLEPGSSRALVHAVDLLPTLAELTGVELSQKVAGQSLLPALNGRDLDRDWVYVHTDRYPQEAVITQRWKLMEIGGRQVVHDLLNDPAEETPLDPDGPEMQHIVPRLRHHLTVARNH